MCHRKVGVVPPKNWRPLYLSTHLPDCPYHVSFRRGRLSCREQCEVAKSSKKVVLESQFVGGYPRFWICVFKLHLLPSMWPIFVEFCSANSEIRRRKRKKERKKERRIPLTCMSGGLIRMMQRLDRMPARPLNGWKRSHGSVMSDIGPVLRLFVNRPPGRQDAMVGTVWDTAGREMLVSFRYTAMCSYVEIVNEWVLFVSSV